VTCIVAVRHRGRVHLGGDSCLTTDDGARFTSALPKVWRAAGGFAIGIAGSTEFDSLLRYRIAWPERVDDPVRHIIVSLPQAIRQLAREDSAEPPEGEALIVYRGRIYELSSEPPGEDTAGHVEILPIAEPYAAVGSGSALACGALASNRGEPRARLLAALRVAARHRSDVAAPFHFLSL
jgi:ATP-dependent protease HslVU (ClpYQ) peptidase subunit